MRAAGVIDALARADAAFEAKARKPHRAWRRVFSFPFRHRRKLSEAKARERNVDDVSPPSNDETATESRVLTERARHAAAAWFGFAGTSEGTAAIAEADAAGLGVTRRVRAVAVAETGRASRFRYAGGCLARLVAGDFFDTKPFAEKRETLRALASALRSGDGQAACFAAAAARGSGRRVSADERGASEARLVDGALFLLTSPEKGWCVESAAALDAPPLRNASKRRNDGARLCALRLLRAFASSGDKRRGGAVAVSGSGDPGRVRRRRRAAQTPARKYATRRARCSPSWVCESDVLTKVRISSLSQSYLSWSPSPS